MMQTLTMEKDAKIIRHLFAALLADVVVVERHDKVMGIVVPARDRELIRQAYAAECARHE